jgi:hypothetical protein
MNTEGYCSVWMRAVDAFNSGDLKPLSQLLAADCVFEHVGRSRDEIITALQTARDQGWERHDTVSVQAVGCLMTELAKNSYADRSEFHVATSLRFNDDGNIVYIATANDNPAIPS